MATREQVGRLYRPTGVKFLKQVLWTSGGKATMSGPEIDLTHPLEGLRFVFKMRDVIAVAAMTTANPLGYLNMIQRVLIEGRNERKKGKASLFDMDLPSYILFATVFDRDTKKPFQYNGVANGLSGTTAGAPSAGTELLIEQPSTPVTGFFTGATGTYDIRIVWDMVFHPIGIPPYLRPGYNVRAQEWKDSIFTRLEFPAIVNGATHALGTDGATTTHTFTSFGSGAGSPTIDIYGLPVFMGPENDAAQVPGYMSRISIPVTTLLQAAGGINTSLLTLEKSNTTRICAIIGVSTVNPFFASLSDTNLTTAGVFIAKNRTVRENVDIFAHKQEIIRTYLNQPVQGVIPFEFLHSNNPDAAYDAEKAADGTTYEIRGTVAGVASALGIFIQEVENFKPVGAQYPA